MLKQERALGDYISDFGYWLKMKDENRKMMIEIILATIITLNHTGDTYFLAVSLADRYLIHVAKSGNKDVPNIIVMATTSVMLAAKIDSVSTDISQEMKKMKASER